MVTSATRQSICAIVLAAGSAERFGVPKQLAHYDGAPLVRRAVEVAASACSTRCILVVGNRWQEVASAASPVPGFLLLNEAHRDGMASSLSLAVRAARRTASAVLVLLADQPLVTAAHLAAMIDCWSGDPREIVATAHSGTAGAPTLFPAACFDELLELRGDVGARALFDNPRYEVRTVPFEAAAADIDTVADLLRLARSARS